MEPSPSWCNKVLGLAYQFRSFFFLELKHRHVCITLAIRNYTVHWHMHFLYLHVCNFVSDQGQSLNTEMHLIRVLMMSQHALIE